MSQAEDPKPTGDISHPIEDIPSAVPDKAPATGRQSVWNYLVFVLSKSSTLIMTVIVARLLTPADFGVFAMALLVTNLFDYMKDLGVGLALVQRPGNWNRFAPTGLTLTVITGVGVGAILAAIAPLGAATLHQPSLTPLIQVLAIGLVISALGVFPDARLRRDLEFRRRLWPQFLGAMVKAGLTIALAAAGLGVWSLVYGQLVGTVVTTLLYWLVARVPVKFGFNRHEARDLIRFGTSLSAVTLLAYAMFNTDYLFIGMRLGDIQLGLYTLAYRLPELLILNLCIVISEVLVSSLSRLQHSRQLLNEHYLEVTTVAMALTAPMSIALAAAAPPVIDTMYGPAYAAAAPALAVLSLYVLFMSMTHHSGDMFKAIGRPGIIVFLETGRLALLVPAVWWAAGHSIVMVALALVLVETAPFIANAVLLRRVADISYRANLKSVLKPMPAAMTMGAVIWGGGQLLISLPSIAILVITVLAGLVAYVVMLWLTARDLFDMGLAAFRSVRGRGTESSPADEPVGLEVTPPEDSGPKI
ncbi:lipopolysaccharide biosynthesis protein [Mycolicibacterium psychrotolerans]|uniref:lipopolysaccharide biosynthesis protein n=1 Tax=Mycolicibacterium psychrotolerans TaxID=216929 RepID=UPI001FED06BE|nr:lipopolysaccharide biosynthesis protein [Mycolicibacterium psychrotolerans]